MSRAALFFGLFMSAGCTRNPYVIGEHFPDECEGALAGALACSGFEDQDAAVGWTETTILGSADIEHTSDEVHRGRGALHAQSSGVESVAVVSREFAPVRAGTLYLRAYLRVPADVPTDTINIFFIGAEPAPDPFTGVDINLEQGVPQIFSPQFAPDRRDGTVAIPRDEWFCFRAELVVDDEDGSIELFVGDDSALLATGVDTLPDEGVYTFRAGVDWSSAQAERFEMYLDDVALGTDPIPCRP
jgi:hypothetical protein